MFLDCEYLQPQGNEDGDSSMIKGKRLAVFFFVAVLISFCMHLPPALSGTAEQKVMADEKSVDVTDVKLAESIMMASPYSFSYERDPFKPISLVVQAEPALPQANVILSEDIPRLHGIISSGGITRALLQIRDKTKLYNAREMVGKYRIESIDAKKVILKLDNSQLELKVGGDEKK